MNKTVVVIGAVLVAMLPWMSGGRDSLALLISAFALLLAGLLVVREPGRTTVGGWVVRGVVSAWVGWGALSLLWSVNRYQTEMWLLMSLIAVIAGILTAHLGERDRKLLITGYLWVAALTGVVGIILYFTGDYNRLTSTFYWANPAAAYLIPAILIGGWQWLKDSTWKNLVVPGITLIGFWLTDSRGATLAFVLVLVAAFVSNGELRRLWKRVALLAITSFVLAFGLAALKSEVGHNQLELGSRYGEAARGESMSGHDRLNYLQSSFAIWWDHPLSGTGAGTFGTVHPQYQHGVSDASSDAHNIYVQSLAEQGIVGTILLAWVIMALLIGVRRGVVAHPQRSVYALAVVALFIHLGLDIDARYPALLVLLAALIGLTYQPLLHRSVRGRQQLVLPALIATTTVLAALNYQSDVQRTHGQIYDDNRDLNAAATSYQRAHSSLVYDPDSWSSEGIDYFSLAAITSGSRTSLNEARDRAQQAITRDPQDSQHYFLLGRVEYLSHSYPPAEKAYRQALALDRYNHPEYYQDLASLQFRMGDTASAYRTTDEGLALYPDTIIAMRQTDETLKPAVAQLLAFRAAGELERGDRNAATATIERAYKLNPDNADVQKLRSQVVAQPAE